MSVLVSITEKVRFFPPRRRESGQAEIHPSTNPLRGIGVVCGAYPAPEPLTDEASKVGALPQTPPGRSPRTSILMRVLERGVVASRAWSSLHHERNIRCPFHLSNAPSVRCGSACSKTWRCAACDGMGRRDLRRFVRSFAGFLGRSPDTAQAEDIRRFQVHQREIGVQPPTINGSVSALRFLFERNARPAGSVAAPGPGALSTQIASGAEC